ncbi:kinetochore-associated protein 1-like [Ornithodoros turicata]|uniref:kinetochore-associated protein 1-like n=1 Tax=Ornithodoros turicata TaxID=34597 RepID=UPI003139B823
MWNYETSRNDQHLYETLTVLTINADNVPFVRCCVFDGNHLAIAVDNAVHVFDENYETVCLLSFQTCIDAIALRSGLLFVADRNFNLHVAKTCQGKVAYTTQVCTAQGNLERVSFQAVAITQMDADDYMLCLLFKNSSLLLCKFRIGALMETLQDCEMTDFFKFVIVDVDTKAPDDFESTLCVCNEQFLVAGNSLLYVPHQGSPYRLFAEFPGGPIVKMIASQDGRSVIILSSEGDLFTVCSKTFIVSSTWTGKQIKDFVLVEKEGNESQVGILTKQLPESTCNLQIYSYPTLELLYSLNVSHLCLLGTFGPSKEELCIVQVIEDKQKNVVRIQVVRETLPQTRLANLIKKRKFLEAQEFAHLFGIPVEQVHWQHLSYLLKEVCVNEGTVDDITSLIRKLPDKPRAAKCCIDAVPACPSSARQLFKFLQQHTLDNLNCVEYDNIHAEIASVLNRVTTFELMLADDSKWLTFLEADLVEGICTLLQAEDISRAVLVWMRHCDEIRLTPQSVGQILNAVPATMTAAQITDWFSGGFLSRVIYQAHDAMEDVCLWVIHKVVSMEMNEKSAWPSGALQLLTVVPELYESLQLDSTLLTAQSWIAVHSMPRLIMTENSSFYRLYYLLSDLKNLQVLWKEHECYLTLQELQNPDEQEVVFSILDAVTTHSATSKIIDKFLLPHLKGRNVDASKVLAAYIDEVLICSPCTWWENAPWEDKVTAITKFISDPNTLMESIEKILAQAPSPWSESIDALASQAELLSLEASDRVNAQRRVVQVKVILREYKMRSVNCTVFSDMKTVIKNILLSGKPSSLADALEIVNNIQIATTEDVYMWHLQNVFLSGHADNFADALQSLPEGIFEKVGSRVANFGWLYLSRYHSIYSPKMDDVAECCVYLLDMLHERTCDSVFHQRRDQVALMHKLRKEFGIKENLSDVASMPKRHTVLQKGFQNCVNSYAGVEELCKKLLTISNVLKLDRESAIETLIQAALKSRHQDLVKVLFQTLFDENKSYKISTSLLKAMVCTSGDVFTLTSNLHHCASSVLSVTPGDKIRESMEISQWIHFLLENYNASNPDKATTDPYSTLKLSCMYETRGFALESSHDSIQRLSTLLWLPDVNKLHTHLIESFTSAYSQLSEKAQTEMCLRLCTIIKQLSCEIQEHEEQAVKAMIMRATTEKHMDFILVAGLLSSLPPSEALMLMKQLIFQTGTNYRLLKTQVAVARKVSVAKGIPEIKSKLDTLFRNAFWGRRLATFGISFKNALLSSDTVTRQNILDEMAVMSVVDIETIRDYCVEYGLSFENVMVKRIDYLLKQAGEMFCKGEGVPLENVEKALEFISPEQAVKTLRKLLGKVDPYCYEIIKFGYGYISKISRVNVERELRVINFVASYRRLAKPTAAEMDAWFNDHPECQEIPAVAHKRLPFHWLLHKSPWKFLNDEIYPETVALWLNIADALELDDAQIRFVAIENAVTLWSSRKANRDILDMKLISTIHRLMSEIEDTDMALACVATVIKGLPKGQTRTKAAELGTTLAFHYSQLETPVPAAHKKYLTFNKLYMQYKVEQALSLRGLDTPDYTALVSKPEELVQKLLENNQWQRLFSNTTTVYECIQEIVENCGIQDLRDILTKNVEGWLNCCSIADMTLDQSMDLHFGQDRSEEQVAFTRCIHLMQHLPQKESKKMLRDIINNGSSYFGLQQEVAGMQCALASFGKEDCEDLFALPFATAISHFLCISYKARLQDLGIPLPLEDLDKAKAAQLARNIISCRGENPKAIKLVFLLCMEFEVDSADLWNSLLSNAVALNMVDLLMASLPTLGRIPATWHMAAFQNAWRTVLKREVTRERCSLLLRCSVIHDLPLEMFAQEAKDRVLFSLICTVLQAKGNYDNVMDTFLTSLPQSLLEKLAHTEDKGSWLFLQLPQVRHALCDLPSF